MVRTGKLLGWRSTFRPTENLFQKAGLAPHIPLTAWRGGIPVYRDGKQVGQATTGGWSPALKKYVALATLRRGNTEIGSRVNMEVTVEHQRKTVDAKVAKLPFFDPPRKRAVFAKAENT